MGWVRKNKGKIDKPIKDYLEGLIKTELTRVSVDDITICIGTDSQKRGGGYVFATAIILVTTGKGGKVMYEKSFHKNKMDIVERMTQEVNMSILCAYDLKDLFDEYGVNVEIHADINQNPLHKSNRALKGAINHITSMAGFFKNYSYKVKPDAWASSCSADRECK